MSLKSNETKKIYQAIQDQNLDRVVELTVRFESAYIKDLSEIPRLEEDKEYYERELEKLNQKGLDDLDAVIQRDEFKSKLKNTMQSLKQLEEFVSMYNDSISWLRNNHLEKLHSVIGQERIDNSFVKILGIIQDSDSIERLFRSVAFSDSPNLCESAADALMRNQFPQAPQGTEDYNNTEAGTWFEINLDRDRIKTYYKIARGRNLYWLKRIASRMRDDLFRSWVIENASDHSCGLKRIGDCDEYILPRETYFIAFPFSNSKIPEVIKDAFETRWSFRYGTERSKKYNAVFAGQAIDNAQILCDICKKILYSKFGVYVISKESGSDISNPNVMLELGIALKFGKPCVLIIEKGTKYPADLQGRLYVQYTTHEELKQKIMEYNEGLERELNISP